MSWLFIRTSIIFRKARVLLQENSKVCIIEQRDDPLVSKMNTVTLISGDKTEVQISREAATVSSTLKSMLEGPFRESDGRIELPTFDSRVLQKVAEYLEYNLQYRDSDNGLEDIPEFDIPTEMALELLLAADYLGI